MKSFLLASAVLLVAVAGRCQAQDWRQTLKKELPLLGHRNWIVIADSAYPAQTSSGIVTVVTGADHLEVVKAVLEALDQSKHVRPIIYTDAELRHVPEQDAKGITAYRAALAKALGKRGTYPVPHEQLIDRLGKAGEKYRILVLKTTLTLPYTSVFLSLDCAYWSGAAEQRLREAIRQAK